MARLSLPPPTVLWRGILRFVDDLRNEWSRARVGGLSAEIAFFGLLGLFPAVIVFAAALGSLDVVIGAGAAADTEEWLLDRVVETFGSDNTLRATIEELFDRSNAGLITAGIVITVYASSRGFTAVVGALDVTYGHEDRRNWISTRVMGFVLTLFTLVVAALVAAMVVVGPLLGGGEEIAERLGAGSAFTTAWVWFRWAGGVRGGGLLGRLPLPFGSPPPDPVADRSSRRRGGNRLVAGGVAGLPRSTSTRPPAA